MHSENQFVYSRERRRFGRQCMFTDRTQPLLSIHPSRSQRLNYILRNPVHTATQLSDQKALSEMQSENVVFTEHGMYHCEGGWPKEVNLNDEESTLRYRKKIERDDNWGVQMPVLIGQTSEVIQINNTIDIYQDFFVDLVTDLGENIRESLKARQKNIFHDPLVEAPRPITVIDWAPNDTKRFLVLHSNLSKNEAAGSIKLEKNNTLNNFYIWDLENPLSPMTTFKSDEMTLKVFYCPKDDTWLAGGDCVGNACIWDTRLGEAAVSICPLEAAHREAVPAVCWVHSKTNTEFYTGSLDGSVKYWDGRDLNQPIHEILLDPVMTDEQSRDRAQGVTVLEFEYTIPVRFIIGTDMGSVFIGNRKGMTPMETLSGGNFRLLMGPIKTIERNPFFVKNFLITGDWCAKIWAEENKGSPTTLLVKKKNEILCGTWSTMRCSLFVTGDMSGELDFWDLLLHQRKPIYSMKFSKPIMHVKFRSDGKYLAVCLANGDVQLLELDKALKHSSSKDKTLIAAMFEREQLRCKLLEARVDEMKLKRQLKLEEANKPPPEPPVYESLDATDPDEFLRLISLDTEFQDVFHNFQQFLAVLDRKRLERQYVMEATEFEIEEQITDLIEEEEEANEQLNQSVE